MLSILSATAEEVLSARAETMIDRGDADEDPQHGEHGARRVAGDGAEGQPEGPEDHAGLREKAVISAKRRAV